MLKNAIVSLLLLPLFLTSCTQEGMTNYSGEWVGKTTNTDDLNLDITIEIKDESAVFQLSNSKIIVTKTFELEEEIQLSLDDKLVFKGIISEDQSKINGFMRLTKDLYPITLLKNGNQYEGKWNLSVLYYLQPNNLKITMKAVTDEEYDAYPMLGSFWCSDFRKNNNNISFEDYKTGLGFDGSLNTSEMILNIRIGDHLIAKASYTRTKKDSKLNTTLSPTNFPINDGWIKSDELLNLVRMEDDIYSDVLEGTEGVVIAKQGEIIYENYFEGFDANTPHDMRSASKSISSAIIGIAIDDNIIEGVNQEIYEYLPAKYQYTRDDLKSKIRVKDLLTMSSGLYIGEDTYQESSNWLKTALEAPMKHRPGTYTDYQSVDPFLLGVYLDGRLDTPLEFYMDKKLFAPLGIINYVMNTDDTGNRPYFGGGLHLTPRDMLKFGQLYLSNGNWKGQQIVSEKWIRESFQKHTRLQDNPGKNKYGYLWWHESYEVNGKTYHSIEARGAGGQYIFVFPELDAVMAITSGNYRNGKTPQPKRIMGEYILPAILK